ncbi:MAG: PAS domain-containing sensor histidine kinase, partial [Bacteroidetes bacterium]
LNEVQAFLHDWLQQTNVQRRFECKIQTKQGQDKWIDVTAARIKFQGEIATIASAFDITERKHSEESLRDSEERFRIITEMISDYAYLDRVEEDGKWTILWITDSFYRLTGYTLEDAQTPDFVMRYIYPDDLQENIEHMQQLLQGNSIRHTGRVITKSGSLLWLEHEARPVWDSQKGRVTYIYGAARDITGRKRVEESLRVSEERYRMVAELMSDYAYLDRVEPDGKFIPVWLTESFTKLTGYTPVESQTYDFIENFVHPDDIPIIVNGIQESLKGNTVNYEVRIFKKDGTMRWLLNEVSPLWNSEHTRVEYMYGAARDITERKIREGEFRKLSAELTLTEQRERRRLAQFLHDVIGQTLALVKMKLQMLEEVNKGPAQIKKEMDDVFKLVDETIANTRTATFDLCPPVLYEFGIAAAIEWLVQKLREQHSLSVTFNNSTSGLSLKDDVGSIVFNCVRELLLNIVKHAKATNIKITLSVNEEKLLLVVTDNGVGFDNALLEEKSRQGSGFGLFNMRQQVSYIGGLLEIDSQPAQGTTVRLSVPILA